MKGLVSIPTVSELERAYEKLLHENPAPPSAEEIILYAHWSRFDPRLAEIWVAFMAIHWQQFDPLKIRTEILKGAWPACTNVLLEFVRRKLSHPQLFTLWKKLVTTEIPKAPGEQFFIGLRILGGKSMLDDAVYSSEEYRKWGYLSRENLIPKSSGNQLSAATRQEILRELIKSSPQVTTEAYWNAIGRCISRRQAERDLKQNRWLRPKGNTKARFFIPRTGSFSS